MVSGGPQTWIHQPKRPLPEYRPGQSVNTSPPRIFETVDQPPIRRSRMAENLPAETIFGVFTTDTDLRIKVWDDAMARFSGVSAAAAQGHQLHQLFPEIEARGLLQNLRRVLANGTVEVLAPAFHRYLVPCPVQKPSQRFSRMLQRVTIAPVVEEADVVGMLVTIEDVTERIERERELAENLSSSDGNVRLRASEALAQIEQVEDEQPSLGALSDSDWRVRQAAVGGLARRSAPDAIGALLELVRKDHRNLAILNSALQVLAMTDVDTHTTLVEFLHDPNPEVRMQAALALGEQRDRRATADLLDSLKDDDLNVRFHAIEALGKIRAPEAAEALAAIAESEDFFLAYPALESLKQIENRNVAPRLAKLLSVPFLREPAIEALGVLGDETAVAPLATLLNTADVPALSVAEALVTLHDRFSSEHNEGSYIAELSRQAIQAPGIKYLLDSLNEVNAGDLRPLAVLIGWLRGPAVDRTLVRLLGEQSIRNEVVAALVRHGEGVIDLLVEQIESDELEIKRAAITALGRLGYKRATKALVKVLQTEPELQIDAANALARVGDEAALDPLLEMIGVSDSAARQAVVGALNSIGSARMPERIKELLLDERPLVRESAAKIAGYFGYPDCADLLLKCSQDEDERVRRAVVEHLPYLEDQRVVQILAEAISKDTPRVRAAAALALANVDDAAALPILLQALQDDDSWVRYFAARSLGKLALPDSLAPLAAVANTEQLNHVRIAALEALGNIGGPEAVTVISAHLRAADQEVARIAAMALEQATSSSELTSQS